MDVSLKGLLRDYAPHSVRTRMGRRDRVLSRRRLGVTAGFAVPILACVGHRDAREYLLGCCAGPAEHRVLVGKLAIPESSELDIGSHSRSEYSQGVTDLLSSLKPNMIPTARVVVRAPKLLQE